MTDPNPGDAESAHRSLFSAQRHSDTTQVGGPPMPGNELLAARRDPGSRAEVAGVVEVAVRSVGFVVPADGMGPRRILPAEQPLSGCARSRSSTPRLPHRCSRPGPRRHATNDESLV